MIFQTEGAIEKIIKGEKTQTRRIVKPDQSMAEDGSHVYRTEVYTFRKIDGMGQPGMFCGHTDHQVYAVGKDYAVQPGRGQPCAWRKAADIGGGSGGIGEIWLPLRIRILSIRREDVRWINPAEATAEGYLSPWAFLGVWTAMHDKSANRPLRTVDTPLAYLLSRPAERYDAWALTFEVA